MAATHLGALFKETFVHLKCSGMDPVTLMSSWSHRSDLHEPFFQSVCKRADKSPGSMPRNWEAQQKSIINETDSSVVNN